MEAQVLKNHKDVVLFLDRPLKGMIQNGIVVTYDVDISRTPKHLLNFMFGMLLSEHLAWNKTDIIFEELTFEEIECINDHIRLNYLSDPYGLVNNSGKISQVTATNIVERDIIKDNGTILVTNGGGKESLAILNIMNELGYPIRSFTVGNQYKTLDLFNERKSIIGSYCHSYSIDVDYINTNYFNNQYRIIPWWLFALPLAVYYGSSTIAAGLGIVESKVWLDNQIPIRPNQSVFSFNYISKVLGMNIYNPLLSISPYGVQKLLVERYPDTIKYQRSCMKDTPFCGKCKKCYGISQFIKAMDRQVEGLPTVSSDLYRADKYGYMLRRILMNIEKKLEGKQYQEWFEHINRNALDFTYDSRNILSILIDHLDITDKDPGLDDFGEVMNNPSQWSKWSNEEFNKFWRKK